MRTPYRFNAAQLKWLDALESGKFTQGFRYLKQMNDDDKTEHCCLGVACEIFDVKQNRPRHRENIFTFECQKGVLPKRVWQLLKLRSSSGDFAEPTRVSRVESLADMNDRQQDGEREGRTHKGIAAYIRQNPWNVFVS